jgi:hypothetical protein
MFFRCRQGYDWDILVFIRFLLRLMTSQTSGAGQEAPKLGGGPNNNQVNKLSHAIAYAEITILTHRSCSTGLALLCVRKKYVIGFFHEGIMNILEVFIYWTRCCRYVTAFARYA